MPTNKEGKKKKKEKERIMCFLLVFVSVSICGFTKQSAVSSALGYFLPLGIQPCSIPTFFRSFTRLDLQHTFFNLFE